jgi:hypothetical protein
MFFRRQRLRIPSFDERIGQLRQNGFEIGQMGSGNVRVKRGICAALVENVPGSPPRIVVAGISSGEEIAVVTHGGYQMFLVTPGGKKMPATAAHLETLHAFTEDLVVGLGLTSYYNTSLGTICEDHSYDRLRGREKTSV